ncbi:MAG TPA: hypothetical protein ENJ53_03315, partial [Phaeodactylibacter sp.]|nr:hypothetical protein [Phaeodactylibacter sp.]
MNYRLKLHTVFERENRQIKFFSSIILIVFFLFPQTSNASHIVGGEMSYRCLGGSTFEVSLTVYRDCYNAAPTAVFDPIASIGIFDANNNLVTSLNGVDSGQLLIPQTVDDTLEILLTDPCLFPPSNVCVNSMTYVDTVILPPISGGYQLVYQRCCRNVSISNIINPFYVGASFVINISETALLECNSSPQFMSQPPVFLCVNEPFVFDQSVTDVDGDSLVYRLCTPFDGASFDVPRPQPPNAPPYNEINWLSPTYTLDNLLGGIPLQIDPATGIMTGTPNTQGIFLVGMCIEEYRDGVLISETRREFQYNVGLCSDLTASFDAPSFQCGDLEVNFQNTSINSDEFFWTFNDPANPNATSTETNPTFTFSDTGSYTVMLIADPNGSCTDTSYMDIFLEKSAMEAAFSYVTLDCTDSVQLALVDMSIDSVHSVESWLWQLSDGQISTEQFPLFVVDSSQNLLVTLTTTSSNGCTEEAQQSIPINLIPSNLLPSEIIICEGDAIQLNPHPPVGLPFAYSWIPDDGLSANNIPSPFASPNENITYTLTISDLVNDCFAELQVDVIVLDNPSLSVQNETNGCSSEETILTANTNLTQANFLWATDAEFNTIVSDSSTLTVTPT